MFTRKQFSSLVIVLATAGLFSACGKTSGTGGGPFAKGGEAVNELEQLVKHGENFSILADTQVSDFEVLDENGQPLSEEERGEIRAHYPELNSAIEQLQDSGEVIVKKGSPDDDGRVAMQVVMRSKQGDDRPIAIVQITKGDKASAKVLEQRSEFPITSLELTNDQVNPAEAGDAPPTVAILTFTQSEPQDVEGSQAPQGAEATVNDQGAQGTVQVQNEQVPQVILPVQSPTTPPGRVFLTAQDVDQQQVQQQEDRSKTVIVRLKLSELQPQTQQEVQQQDVQPQEEVKTVQVPQAESKQAPQAESKQVPQAESKQAPQAENKQVQVPQAESKQQAPAQDVRVETKEVQPEAKSYAGRSEVRTRRVQEQDSGILDRVTRPFRRDRLQR